MKRVGLRKCKICGCIGRKYLSVATVSSAFDVSERTVRRLIGEGALEAVKFGSQWRILHRSFDRYVLANTESVA